MCSAPECCDRVEAQYEIGGLRIALESVPFHESDNLAAFRTESRQAPDLRMKISAVNAITPPESVTLRENGETTYTDFTGRRIRLCLTEDKQAVLYKVTEVSPGFRMVEIREKEAAALGSYLVLRWMDLPGLFLQRYALFLHASFVEWEGKAILFTGRKQIGKSTQAELWRMYKGAAVVNGDRALLRQVSGRWLACGSPFCGTSGICFNRTLPIAAIVVLAQAPYNAVGPAAAQDAVMAFLTGMTIEAENEENLNKAEQITEEIIKDVPILRMLCRPDSGAADCLEAYLRNRSYV